MKKSRLTVLIVFVLTAVFLFAACSASTGSSSASAATEGSTAQAAGESNPAQSADESSSAQPDTGDASGSENAVYGNVTEIDGSSITLELGTLNQDAIPDGDDGQQGQPPSGGGQGPSDMPSGQPYDMPSGQPSDIERPSMLTLTGETITIEIADESLITTPEFSLNAQESSQPSGQASGLDLIQVGAVLKIVYGSDNETIQSITVINGFGGGNMQGGPAGGNAPAPSASAAE